MPRNVALVLAGMACGLAVLGAGASRPRAGVLVPAAAFDPAASSSREAHAVLAGGCFWGVQAVFEHVNGVSHVTAGYTGGTLANPTYQDVGTERTGHAESVDITYDPSKVSYGTLLRVFFAVAHDPTELNRQGPDEGPSYRSNIFVTTDAERRVAEAYIAQLDAAHVFSGRIVTRVDRFDAFYQAEAYHQDFLVHNPANEYIVVNDLPKLSEFKRLLPALYSDAPVLYASSAAR